MAHNVTLDRMTIFYYAQLVFDMYHQQQLLHRRINTKFTATALNNMRYIQITITINYPPYTIHFQISFIQLASNVDATTTSIESK